MYILQFIAAIPWFTSGLMVWPAFLIFRGSSNPRARQLRRIFFVTLGALAGVGATLGVVGLLGEFNHNWLPVTLLFPLINFISIIVSVGELVRQQPTPHSKS
jgi:hypothetical protein